MPALPPSLPPSFPSSHPQSLELVAGLSQDKLLQCHGSFETATCLDCRRKFKLDEIRDAINMQRVPLCPDCCPDQAEEATAAAAAEAKEGLLPPPSLLPSLPSKQRGLIKPDIIFFGESLGDRFTRAMDYDKQRVDLLLVLGSSLKVGATDWGGRLDARTHFQPLPPPSLPPSLPRSALSTKSCSGCRSGCLKS